MRLSSFSNDHSQFLPCFSKPLDCFPLGLLFICSSCLFITDLKTVIHATNTSPRLFVLTSCMVSCQKCLLLFGFPLVFLWFFFFKPQPLGGLLQDKMFIKIEQAIYKTQLILIPSFWVVPVHQPQASSIVHRTWITFNSTQRDCLKGF